MALKRFLGGFALAALSTLVAAPSAQAQDKSIVVASTTSTEQSGLFGHILPEFTKKTGIAVKVVALGTGQALDTGRRGDADVVFVHDRAAEDKFVAEGFGIDRRDVMYNDFVLVGPKADPAKVAGGKDIAVALKKIADTQAPFVSRGDKSGTHAAELRYFKDAGIKVRVVALGTGQALDMARRGDADVVFVHDEAAERKFVAEGHGVERKEVMYNDFVLIGPKGDPAKVAGGKDITAALKKIQSAQAPFVSRGDKSGTHAAELRLWKETGIDIAAQKGPWYRETGSGMGPALNTASSMNGYVLADRSTWLAFKNRGDLAILVEGDKRLFNQYGIILVNPDKHANVKKDLGQQFIDWIVSAEGQNAIRSYKIEGQQLFFPNADPGQMKKAG
jgi:tungstate transport system substrate-binding protein